MWFLIRRIILNDVESKRMLVLYLVHLAMCFLLTALALDVNIHQTQIAGKKSAYRQNELARRLSGCGQQWNCGYAVSSCSTSRHSWHVLCSQGFFWSVPGSLWICFGFQSCCNWTLLKAKAGTMKTFSSSAYRRDLVQLLNFKWLWFVEPRQKWTIVAATGANRS